MIVLHGAACQRHVEVRLRMQRFGHQTRFIEQLVALQRALLRPLAGRQPPQQVDPVAALPTHGCGIDLFHPGIQPGQDHAGNPVPPAITQVFPREIVVPVEPARIRAQLRLVGLAHQSQVAHVQHRQPLVVLTPGVHEGVELLHVTHGLRGLLRHPQPHARLQRAMHGRQRPLRQHGAVAHGQYTGLEVRHRNQHRDQLDDALRRTGLFERGIHPAEIREGYENSTCPEG